MISPQHLDDPDNTPLQMPDTRDFPLRGEVSTSPVGLWITESKGCFCSLTKFLFSSLESSCCFAASSGSMWLLACWVIVACASALSKNPTGSSAVNETLMVLLSSRDRLRHFIFSLAVKAKSRELPAKSLIQSVHLLQKQFVFTALQSC